MPAVPDPAGPDPTVPADLVVAVDGPSGSGKSSAARGVARRLGLRYLDTGATYRALTWWVLEQGIDPADAGAVGAAAAGAGVAVGTHPDAPTVSVHGHDVARAIRGPEVTAAVSPVSAVPAVRTHLVALQRALIGPGGIVVEGRDIAAVVAPQAAVKVFLTASPEARARRRAAELTAAGLAAPGAGVAAGAGASAGAPVEATLRDLQRRDRLDSTRDAAPLVRAPDAVELDATELSLEEVIEAILALVPSRAGRVRP